MIAIDLECVGGPLDGLRVHSIPCTSMSFDKVRLSTGEVTKDLYGLEVHDGSFCLRYIASTKEPVA